MNIKYIDNKGKLVVEFFEEPSITFGQNNTVVYINSNNHMERTISVDDLISIYS